ncbi:MAG: hypothetical protein LAT81_14270 [Oceanicaulis sp.]|nr:hypothetical protein [Oceanicaulis sp.]
MNNRQAFTTQKPQSILERKYLEKVLREEGKNIIDEQSAIIDSYDLIDTRIMRERRGFRFVETENADGTLEISFVKYLRFLDMTRRMQQHSVQPKLRKSLGIYNRIIFGRFNEIQKRLRFGFTEQVKEQLRNELTINLEQ